MDETTRERCREEFAAKNLRRATHKSNSVGGAYRRGREARKVLAHGGAFGHLTGKEYEECAQGCGVAA